MSAYGNGYLRWPMVAVASLGLFLLAPNAEGKVKVLVEAGGGGGDALGAHVFAGRFGLVPKGDACGVRTIERPRRFGRPAVLANGVRRLRLVLFDLRRPLRIITKLWGANRSGSPQRLRAFRLRPYRGTAGIKVVGWTALVAIPPRAAGTVVFHVSWADRDDCLVGPDWLNAGLRISRPTTAAVG